MPYNGIWLMTKKMRRVHYPRRQLLEIPPMIPILLTPVHINFWLNAIFDSGAATSGRRGVNGLMRSRNRTARC